MFLPCSVRLAAALVAAASLASAAPLRSAQARSHARHEVQTADLSGGVSRADAGAAGLWGWGLSGAYPLRGALSLVGDLSGHYGSFAGNDLNQLAVMGGVRHRWHPARQLSPFAEGLVGVVRLKTSLPGTDIRSSSTDPALAVGGGADYRLNQRWAARGLFHLRFVRGEGVTDTDPRLSLGLVYRIRH